MRTAIPNKAIKPIPAEILNGIPRNQSAKTPPIADNGIGFNQEYASKIFEVFQRLHGKGEFEGTGIGLAICNKIAENHNAIIKATSEVNEGATFHLYFPMFNH